MGRQLSAYLLFHRTPGTSPFPPPALKSTHAQLSESNAPLGSCVPLLRPMVSSGVKLGHVSAADAAANATANAKQLKSSQVRARPCVNNSGSASQGTALSLCPLLTLKSPMGPGGCGKSEARSRLNGCVIEFPHSAANVCMSAGASVC